MNNRYLFKAKRSSDGTWILGCGILERKHGTVLVWADKERRIFETYIDPSTLCQCTGLKDKNGNLIWENDIVITNGFVGKIVWYENDTAFLVLPNNDIKNEIYCLGYWLAEYDVEVIDNIFDNPELLEVEL